MQLTCPCCHTRYPLDASNQDESARELLALRGDLPPRIWNPLIAYLGLFRSETRALAWDRALKLAKEVREIGQESGAWDSLETALCETVEALRFKGGKPLKNHNYLKRVLESQGPVTRDQGSVKTSADASRSKAATAMTALQEWGAGDWLRGGIAAGLCACLAQSLKFQPAADIITLNADTWYLALKSKLTVEELDLPRLVKGFEIMLPKLVEWPKPAQLVDALPKRTLQKALRHEENEEDRARGREAARRLSETFAE